MYSLHLNPGFDGQTNKNEGGQIWLCEPSPWWLSDGESLDVRWRASMREPPHHVVHGFQPCWCGISPSPCVDPAQLCSTSASGVERGAGSAQDADSGAWGAGRGAELARRLEVSRHQRLEGGPHPHPSFLFSICESSPVKYAYCRAAFRPGGNPGAKR